MHDEPAGGDNGGVPGWVKVFGLVALVLALVVATVVLTGMGGEHGPGRHLPSATMAGAHDAGHREASPVAHGAPLVAGRSPGMVGPDDPAPVEVVG